jgi:hypothetical protein
MQEEDGWARGSAASQLRDSLASLPQRVSASEFRRSSFNQDPQRPSSAGGHRGGLLAVVKALKGVAQRGSGEGASSGAISLDGAHVVEKEDKR